MILLPALLLAEPGDARAPPAEEPLMPRSLRAYCVDMISFLASPSLSLYPPLSRTLDYQSNPPIVLSVSNWALLPSGCRYCLRLCCEPVLNSGIFRCRSFPATAQPSQPEPNQPSLGRGRGVSGGRWGQRNPVASSAVNTWYSRAYMPKKARPKTGAARRRFLSQKNGQRKASRGCCLGVHGAVCGCRRLRCFTSVVGHSSHDS